MGKKGSRRQGIPIEYDDAAAHLERLAPDIESMFQDGGTSRRMIHSDQPIRTALYSVFASTTQAYREALLGCALAKLCDSRVNVRLPYAKQGPDAFNGRTLDKEVVNPFFKRNRIPSSTGPYLSALRRSVSFVPETLGQRDQDAYDAFLRCVEHLANCESPEEVEDFLRYVIQEFFLLRQQSQIPLVAIPRFSLPQYGLLVSRLLETPSGGRWPALIATAMFRAISRRFNLDWEVQSQGINEADAATGAPGDITVISAGRVVLAAEVTERSVDRGRVVSTFTTKIAEAGISDYIFFATPDTASEAASQAHRYFAQGHEINFVDLPEWIRNTLITVGVEGRAIFNLELLALLGNETTPAALKVTWNHAVTNVASGG